MEYAIFISIILIIIWIYNRIMYYKSNYGKFQYYLNGETNWFIKNLMGFTDTIIFLIGLALIIFIGGTVINFFYFVLFFKFIFDK